MTNREFLKKAAPVVIIFAVIVGGFFGLAHLTRRKPCVERGEDYFKSIGSWPTLSNGSDSAQVVRVRCNRTDNAFPD